MIHTDRCQFLIDNLDLPAAAGVEDARWEKFQIEHLDDDGTFRIENKARQIAWSFTVAAEATAEAVLTGQGSIFISINQDEATEKIRYAKAVYENLTIGGLPKLVRDNAFSLEFSNGGRLLSLPSRAPRGKARMNFYGDEFAHAMRDREIYTAALPVVSKGGRIRIGSSPMGASGVFWEIYSESLRKYLGYHRKKTPWWEIYAFCKNVPEAIRLAPIMPTAHRVDSFGNERIQAIYANMLEEDFQQEYECEFVDETTAWIPWEIIQKNQTSFDNAGMQWFHAKSVDDALALIPQVLEAIKQKHCEPVLFGGIDIGRKHDLSEFFGVGKSTSGQLPLRMTISLDRVPFDEQQSCFRELITRLPFAQVLIDRNGIGMQLAENLEKTHKAQGVDFTNASKQLWAVEGKLQAERGNTPLPADRDIAYQIHSIKKTTTAAKNIVFDTARNEKHHADKAWAWFLGIWAAKTSGPTPGAIVVNPTKLQERHKSSWRS